ncbi:hypothetical protein FNV43_RR22850 [Rhamnella rubrinervis]|uniref:Uncharacterized protein n=1 Tax=Rhamnella rubrinervis TaxID=2594499 RepID=A0A8K0DV27_9ROSA|nr:hypothetical protein FNV43_RR22850 [Rhamnella rubrinervis]
MPYFRTHSRRIKHDVEVNNGTIPRGICSFEERESASSGESVPLEGDEGGESEGGSDSGVIADSGGGSGHLENHLLGWRGESGGGGSDWALLRGGGSGHLENQPPLGGDGGGRSDSGLIAEGGGGSDEHLEN